LNVSSIVFYIFGEGVMLLIYF